MHTPRRGWSTLPLLEDDSLCQTLGTSPSTAPPGTVDHFGVVGLQAHGGLITEQASLILQLPIDAEEPEEGAMVEQTDEAEDPSL